MAANADVDLQYLSKYLQKRKNTSYFMDTKKTVLYISYLDRKVIFLICTLSVFDIPKLCNNLHNSTTEI